MPAVYVNYPCQVCGDSHTLYFPGVMAPDLSRPHFYTCTALPVSMRITRGDRWKPVRGKPQGAIVVHGSGQELRPRTSSCSVPHGGQWAAISLFEFERCSAALMGMIAIR
jgi:hypothetical protein